MCNNTTLHGTFGRFGELIIERHPHLHTFAPLPRPRLSRPSLSSSPPPAGNVYLFIASTYYRLKWLLSAQLPVSRHQCGLSSDQLSEPTHQSQKPEPRPHPLETSSLRRRQAPSRTQTQAKMLKSKHSISTDGAQMSLHRSHACSHIL